jgi:hypothetical protein
MFIVTIVALLMERLRSLYKLSSNVVQKLQPVYSVTVDEADQLELRWRDYTDIPGQVPC